MRRLALIAAALFAALVACSTPKEEPTVPITGTLQSAVGSLAPLTAGSQKGAGTGFSVNAMLGTRQVVVTDMPWTCYTPAPPQYPNFDIEATDGSTYLFAISISPGFWGPGTKNIDGVNVVVGLVTQDRGVIATSGQLTLTSAGSAADTAGNTCKFSLTNVPVFGERDPD